VVTAYINETYATSGEWFLIEVVKQDIEQDEDRIIVGSGGDNPQITYMSEISSVAGAIMDATAKDVHMFAFRFTDDETPLPTQHQERNVIIETARKRFAEGLVSAYYNVYNLRTSIDGLLGEEA
jgi:hypothetical protein